MPRTNRCVWRASTTHFSGTPLSGTSLLTTPSLCSWQRISKKWLKTFFVSFSESQTNPRNVILEISFQKSLHATDMTFQDLLWIPITEKLGGNFAPPPQMKKRPTPPFRRHPPGPLRQPSPLLLGYSAPPLSYRNRPPNLPRTPRVHFPRPRTENKY